MKREKLLSKRGQAAVELTIFGTLVLLGFSVLLMYGQRLDTQNQLKMESFRQALQKAYQLNSSVAYTAKKDTRMFNLFSGFGQGQGSTLGASASVMWQKGIAGHKGESSKGKDASYAFYSINDVELELERRDKDSYGFDGSKRTVKVPVSVWKEERTKEEYYYSPVTKQETPPIVIYEKDKGPVITSEGGIRNIRSSDLKDTIYNTLYTRFDKSADKEPWDNTTPLPEYETGPEYSNSYGGYLDKDTNRVVYSKDRIGSVVHRERTWNTNTSDIK